MIRKVILMTLIVLSMHLMLLPFNVFCQEANYSFFKLSNGSVIFEKVYEIKDTSVDVERLLALNVPKISGITDFNKTSELITAKLRGININYKKYGGKWANTWTYVIHPMFADVVISWKEQKYRVTISNIRFIPSGANFSLNLADGIAEKKGTEFSTKAIIVRSSKYVEDTLVEMFTVNENEDNW